MGHRHINGSYKNLLGKTCCRHIEKLIDENTKQKTKNLRRHQQFRNFRAKCAELIYEQSTRRPPFTKITLQSNGIIFLCFSFFLFWLSIYLPAAGSAATFVGPLSASILVFVFFFFIVSSILHARVAQKTLDSAKLSVAHHSDEVQMQNVTNVKIVHTQTAHTNRIDFVFLYINIFCR